MRRSTLAVLAILLFTRGSHADTVQMNDGSIIEASAIKQDPQGYWIDGVLFKKEDVVKIERTEGPKTPWWESLARKFGWKSDADKKREADLQAYKERMKKHEQEYVQSLKEIAQQKASEPVLAVPAVSAVDNLPGYIPEEVKEGLKAGPLPSGEAASPGDPTPPGGTAAPSGPKSIKEANKNLFKERFTNDGRLEQRGLKEANQNPFEEVNDTQTSEEK